MKCMFSLTPNILINWVIFLSEFEWIFFRVHTLNAVRSVTRCVEIFSKGRPVCICKLRKQKKTSATFTVPPVKIWIQTLRCKSITMPSKLHSCKALNTTIAIGKFTTILSPFKGLRVVPKAWNQDHQPDSPELFWYCVLYSGRARFIQLWTLRIIHVFNLISLRKVVLTGLTRYVRLWLTVCKV